VLSDGKNIYREGLEGVRPDSKGEGRRGLWKGFSTWRQTEEAGNFHKRDFLWTVEGGENGHTLTVREKKAVGRAVYFSTRTRPLKSLSSRRGGGEGEGFPIWECLAERKRLRKNLLKEPSAKGPYLLERGEESLWEKKRPINLEKGGPFLGKKDRPQHQTNPGLVEGEKKESLKRKKTNHCRKKGQTGWGRKLNQKMHAMNVKTPWKGGVVVVKR